MSASSAVDLPVFRSPANWPCGIRASCFSKRGAGLGGLGIERRFIYSGFAASLPVLSRLAAAQELHRLSMEGAEIVRNRAKKFPAGIVMGEGLLLALRYRDPDGCQRYGAELGEKFGRKVSYLSTEAVRAKLKSKVYFHGLLDAGAFHIHPLRYALALARQAEEAGARLHEGSRVVEVSAAGAELAVRTASEQFAPAMSFIATALTTAIFSGRWAAPCCR